MLRLEGIEIVQNGWRLSADITLPAGGATALIGPSGAGKSTLLNVIAGFVDPIRGRVTWQGRDLTTLSPAARPVTLVFQEHNLFAHLAVFENVALGLRPDLRLSVVERKDVEAALAAVGLAGFGSRRPPGLSGGERSRVALARALLRRRPLLLLDEPFAALGPALRAEMLDLVDRICSEQGATLLMVTHQPADALRLADLTVVVVAGTVLAPRPTQPLFADPPPELRDYLGQ